MNFSFRYIFVILSLTSCGPQGANQSATSRQSNSSSNLSSNPSSTNKTADGKIGSVSTQKKTTLGTSSEKMNQMLGLSLGELKIMLSERSNQDLQDQEELELLTAMNKALCDRLNTVRTSCPTIVKLISDGLQTRVQCDGSLKQESSSDTIEVSVADIFKDQYVLIVNDLFKSTPFSKGKTKITFQSLSGGDDKAPKFSEVFKIVIRPTNENASLPDLGKNPTLSISLLVNSMQLLNSKFLESENPDFASANKEFKVDIAEINTIRQSSKCKTDKASINELKSKISEVVKANQAARRALDYQKQNSQ